MKKLFTLVFIGFSINAFSQAWVDDSVAIGAGYVNRVFYSLENGVAGTIPFNDKDFLVDVSEVQSASIRINGAHGSMMTLATLYEYTAGDTTDWATLDTAGMASETNYTRRWDAQDSYYPSAFEEGATGHPNYGWGVYNSITHDVNGDKLFVYRTVGNVWKKLWIKKLSATTFAFTILVDNIGGGAEETITISKQGITNKSFIYYSFANDSVYNIEPNMDSYDLIFTKHIGDYLTGGSFVPNQAVTGVEINHDVMVAEAAGIVADDAEYQNYTLTDNLQGIGARWKYLNASFQWEVQDSLSYFIQDVDGDVWQIRFTQFVGAGVGKYKFQKRQVGWVAVENETGKLANFNIFPNPASDFIQLAYFLNQETEHATLNILDLSGKTVLSQQLANQQGFNQTTIDLTSLNLPSGVYVARVQVGNDAGTQKFIVQ